jgi:signal recognition particle subunit SEC65
MTNKADESVDQAVLALLVKVEQKKREIEKAKTRPFWKTSCTFGRDETTTADRTNIQTVRDVRKLVEIYAFLNTQEAELSKAAKQLGVDFNGTWQAYPISDWKEDLKTRVEMLSIEKKQKELEELDIKVNRLVSPEQRRVMELRALQEALKD